MNILARYLQTVRPKRYAVLGVVLRPFSIGHYLLLAEQGSILIDDAQHKATLEDLKDEARGEFLWTELMLGLSVCRHSYEDFEAILNDVELLKEEFGTVDRIVKTYLEEQGDNFFPTEEFAIFSNYVQEGHKIPMWQFNSPEGNHPRKKGVSKHWTAQITEDLTQKTNRTVSEIRNMPMLEAWQAWAIAAENDGLITLSDEIETARVEEMEKAGNSNLEIEGDWEQIKQAAKKRGKLYG